MDVSYLVEVAWGPTNFSDVGDNITADVLSVEVLRGRDYASQLVGKSAAGKLRAMKSSRPTL